MSGRNQSQLPGVARKRSPRGRHRRAFDQLARHLRNELGSDPVIEYQLTELRSLADRKDELEADPDGSAYTYVQVCRADHDLRNVLLARMSVEHSLADLLSGIDDGTTHGDTVTT